MSEHYVEGAPSVGSEGRLINGFAAKLSFISLVAAVVAGLLVYAPTAWITSPVFKITAVAVCMAVSAISLLFTAAGAAKQPGSLLVRYSALAISVLPVAYAMSWYLNNHVIDSIGGVSVDTLLFMLFAATSFVAAALMVRTQSRATVLLKVVVGAAVLATLYQYVAILTNSSWFLGSEHSVTATIVGKWNELGALLVVGVLGLLSAALPTRTAAKAYVRVALIALMTFLLLVINFNMAWYIMLVGAVGMIACAWMQQKKGQMTSGDAFAPMRLYAAAAVAVVALIGSSYGDTVSPKLPAPFAVPAVEVRPSLATTLDLARLSHSSNAAQAVFGTGPNSFQQAWVMYKPLSVNLTQFWSAEFPVGFSNITTAFLSVGWLGLIGWMMPLLTVAVAAFFFARRRDLVLAADRNIIQTLTVLAVALWATTLLYATGPALAWLLFVIAGAAVGYTAANIEDESLVVENKTATARMTVLGGYAGLALVSVFAVFMFGRFMLSSAYMGMATTAFSNSDLATAQKLNNMSIQYQPTSDNLRTAMIIDYAMLQKIASEATTPQTLATQQQQFMNVFKDAIAQGVMAQRLDPRDYRPYAEIAQFYELLVALKVPDADTQAQRYYAQAAALNPTNPAIPLLIARLKAAASVHDNFDMIRQQLATSIQLKGNYTDAFMLAEQIAVSLNDSKSAIMAAEAAVQSAPADPTLWFQLGMLFYASGDNEDAAKAFAQSIKLAPQQQYANAEYFLGITDYKLGRTQDATTIFADIAQKNPNNDQIKSILSDLYANKNPFQPAAPAATATPAPATKTPAKAK